MIGILQADKAEVGFLAEGRQHDFKRAFTLLGDKSNIRQRVGDAGDTAGREIRIGFRKGRIFADIGLGGQGFRKLLELIELGGRLANADLLAGDVLRLADRLVTSLLQDRDGCFGQGRCEAIALHALLGDRRRPGNDVEFPGFKCRENAVPRQGDPFDLHAQLLADLIEEIDVQADMFPGIDKIERGKRRLGADLQGARSLHGRKRISRMGRNCCAKQKCRANQPLQKRILPHVFLSSFVSFRWKVQVPQALPRQADFYDQLLSIQIDTGWPTLSNTKLNRGKFYAA
ncbi:hypothetical protein RHSP_30813 [Rhizobium freirei PRF 81]|uniref:Uncharacterized protein n=1 Tax=Rhizobium freirei PRF 81 TaxID=363754 RepID=N6U2A9_9HYPH|nr:hypothetical protein RHSP_30813 [Rhizobium freirei PRF 81]